jgi:hypothetical protein
LILVFGIFLQERVGTEAILCKLKNYCLLPHTGIAAPALFNMLLGEVTLFDFILELPLAFPVEFAPSTEEAELALANTMPTDRARVTTKTLDTIFVIGHRGHTHPLILSDLNYETRIHILRYT